MAHALNDDFNFEQAQKQLEPCVNVKKEKEGSPVWCLCSGDGTLIRWTPGDDPDEAKKMKAKEAKKTKAEKEKEQKAAKLLPNDEEAWREKEASSGGSSPVFSECSAPHLKKSRSELCEWVGDTEGSCCSIKEGCANGKKIKLDNK